MDPDATPPVTPPVGDDDAAAPADPVAPAPTEDPAVPAPADPAAPADGDATDGEQPTVAPPAV